MTEDFTKSCTRTESGAVPLGEKDLSRLLHAGIGLATESGEFLDALKKHLYYNKPLDRINLQEELGDLLWYIGIACDALGTTVELEMARVIAKLMVRYPDKYEDFLANNRNLDAERTVLENVNGDTIQV